MWPNSDKFHQFSNYDWFIVGKNETCINFHKVRKGYCPGALDPPKWYTYLWCPCFTKLSFPQANPLEGFLLDGCFFPFGNMFRFYKLQVVFISSPPQKKKTDPGPGQSEQTSNVATPDALWKANRAKQWESLKNSGAILLPSSPSETWRLFLETWRMDTKDGLLKSVFCPCFPRLTLLARCSKTASLEDRIHQVRHLYAKDDRRWRKVAYFWLPKCAPSTYMSKWLEVRS